MLKDPNFYITIVGTGLTIFGLYLTIRHRYAGRITYVREGSISLFNDIIQNIQELTMTYNGEGVATNMVILKGHLINSGHKDITDEMVGERLSFSLPDGYRWRKAAVTTTSPGLTATCQVEDARFLRFNLGLFRCKEHFAFEALAEVPIEMKAGDPPSVRLNKALKVTHRIADTQPVTTAVLPPDPTGKPLWRKEGITQFAIMVLTFSVIGLVEARWLKPAKLTFMAGSVTNSVAVQVIPRADGMVQIKDMDSGTSHTTNAAAFFKEEFVTADSVPYHRRWKDFIPPAILLLATGSIALYELVTYRKAKKLYKLLKPSTSA